jgi:chromosome segregation ATPase
LIEYYKAGNLTEAELQVHLARLHVKKLMDLWKYLAGIFSKSEENCSETRDENGNFECDLSSMVDKIKMIQTAKTNLDEAMKNLKEIEDKRFDLQNKSKKDYKGPKDIPLVTDRHIASKEISMKKLEDQFNNLPSKLSDFIDVTLDPITEKEQDNLDQLEAKVGNLSSDINNIMYAQDNIPKGTCI